MSAQGKRRRPEPDYWNESITLPPDTLDLREARRLTERLCAYAGCTSEVTDLAVLLTGDVVSNALALSRSEVTLAVTAEPTQVIVEVSDHDDRPPPPQSVGGDALGGSGVGLLGLMSTEWGVRTERVGKTVWFVVRAG
jgi:anti-sigma regulatory factor (Ser/Thr protein kinase)